MGWKYFHRTGGEGRLKCFGRFAEFCCVCAAQRCAEVGAATLLGLGALGWGWNEDQVIEKVLKVRLISTCIIKVPKYIKEIEIWPCEPAAKLSPILMALVDIMCNLCILVRICVAKM